MSEKWRGTIKLYATAWKQLKIWRLLKANNLRDLPCSLTSRRSSRNCLQPAFLILCDCQQALAGRR
jgi:hypothetical protein